MRVRCEFQASRTSAVRQNRELVVGYRLHTRLTNRKRVPFNPFLVEPNLWLVSNIGARFAAHYLDKRNPVDGGIATVPHYENTDLERTVFSGQNDMTWGFTNLWLDATRYWLEQDALNYRALGAEAIVGPTVTVGPGSFTTTLATLPEHELEGVYVVPIPGEDSEARKRLGGHPSIGNFGWLSFTDGVYGEAPQWISAEGQYLTARGRTGIVTGFIRTDNLVELHARYRPHTIGRYSIELGMQFSINSPDDLPSYG
jgi:hypothetical protein